MGETMETMMGAEEAEEAEAEAGGTPQDQKIPQTPRQNITTAAEGDLVVEEEAEVEAEEEEVAEAEGAVAAVAEVTETTPQKIAIWRCSLASSESPSTAYCATSPPTTTDHPKSRRPTPLTAPIRISSARTSSNSRSTSETARNISPPIPRA